ncbi:MAG: hypothetical protein ACODAE_05220 [Gemmatimonadota bacterium]
MTWSYRSSAPNSSDRSWIRLRIGDTSSGDALLQDEEIDAMIDAEGNRYAAAAICCETVAAKFARKVEKGVGRLRVSAQQQYEHYTTLAERLRREAGTRVAPFAGGISVSGKRTERDDSDRDDPAFRRGMHDIDAARSTST